MLTTSKSHFQGMEMGKSAVPSPTKPLIDIIVRSKNPARPGLHTIVLSMQEKTGGLQASISAAHFLSAATQLPQPGTAPEPWISKKRSSRYGGSGSGWFTRLAAPVPRVTGNIRNNDGTDGKGTQSPRTYLNGEKETDRTKMWATYSPAGGSSHMESAGGCVGGTDGSWCGQTADAPLKRQGEGRCKERPQTLWGAGCAPVALPAQMGGAASRVPINKASQRGSGVVQLPSIRTSSVTTSSPSLSYTVASPPPPSRLRGFRVMTSDLSGTACFSASLDETKAFGRRHLESQHGTERLLW